MPAGRDCRGKAAARGKAKAKGPEALNAENDQEGSLVDGQADRLRTRDVLGGTIRNHNISFAKQQARLAQKSGSEYDRLLADGIRHINEERCCLAEAAFRKAIALNPADPIAHYNLGQLHLGVGRVAQAAPNFVRAAALVHLEGSVDWAGYISTAFDALADPECSVVAKPEWWNDKDLLALSKAVTRVQACLTGAAAHRAANVQQWRMHGHIMRLKVLSAEGDLGWQVGPRSAADLNEAAKHAGVAAELFLKSCQSSSMAASLLRKAADLFHKAADMEVIEADAKAAEAAAQADFKAAEAAAQAVVRAEAETKANAAAEALLAEETVALAAAASAPSKGKAKGKPKGKSSGKP